MYYYNSRIKRVQCPSFAFRPTFKWLAAATADTRNQDSNSSSDRLIASFSIPSGLPSDSHDYCRRRRRRRRCCGCTRRPRVALQYNEAISSLLLRIASRPLFSGGAVVRAVKYLFHGKMRTFDRSQIVTRK